jgi:parallel beta-helix repeat protein
LTSTNIPEGTNLYWTPNRFAAALAGTTTSALAEGSNLYFTSARATTSFAQLLAATNTSALAEGTNLYFTNGRVQTYLDTMDKGYFFSSTSADAWDLTKNRWSTTSSDFWLTTKSLTAASTTLLGDTNTWTGLNSFAQLTVGNATATNSFTNSLTALFGSFGTFSATNTQATSTIAGGFDVGSGGLTYDLSSGVTSIANLELGSSAFAPDSGLVTWTDMGVTAASPIGTQNAYTAAFDGNALFTLSSISDGADGISAATVGIGTTSPFARFAITGFAGQTFPLLQIASSTDAPYLTLTADGKLGLGTTTPTDLLTVAGNTTVTGTLTGGNALFANSTTTNATTTSFFSSVLSATTGTITNLFGTLATLTGLTSTNSTSTNATTTNAFNTNFVATNATSTSFFASTLAATNGRISSLVSCDTIDSDANGNLFCGVDAGAGGSSEVNWTFFNQSGVRVSTTTNQVLIGAVSTTSLAKLEVQGNQYVSGNVGIGSTSPYAKLSVTGNGLFDGAITASTFNATSSTGYLLNGVTIATGSTTLNNYYFAGATMPLSNTGNSNIAFGIQSGQNVISGSANNFIGIQAGRLTTSGDYNNFIGGQAGFNNTLGSHNVGIGKDALFKNDTGNSNIAIGWSALYGTTGFPMSSSTAIGVWSGMGNALGTNNTFLGDEANVLSGGPFVNASAIGSHAKVGASNSIVLGGTGALSVNVGIGTTSPFARLSVAGDIFATGTISGFGGLFTNATTTNFSTANLSVTGAATSTFANGIQLSAGCFRNAAGACVGGGKESTYVVAAANSTNKAYADYVTDFSSDEVEINQAIQAAYAGGRGGKVYLLEGDYKMSTGAGDKILMATSTSLIGSGLSTVIHVASSTNAVVYTIAARSTPFITIANLSINGHKANNSSGQVGIDWSNVSTSTIQNVRVLDMNSYGVSLASSHANKITGVTVENAYEGIHIALSMYNTISGNTGTRSQFYGISLVSSSNLNTVMGTH